MSTRVPFNQPHVTGHEFEFINQAIANQHLSGDGPFTHKCQHWIEQQIGCNKALLTHSCTGALEMAAILADIAPGDEVIMPSYTFVSTANAFVLRGGVPVFVDIRADTLNIDEALIEAAITPRTKAIVIVHYAGVGARMDVIMDIAVRHGVLVVEDAAQGVMASVDNAPLGSLGHLAAVSFHETKNVISGEGGALLINDERFVARSEIIWEKGTNRKAFFRGQVDKYTWVDVGSSYLPSELVAAFLWAQLEEAESITSARIELWNNYHKEFAEPEQRALLRRPVVPENCKHNAHMYYLVLPDPATKSRVLARLRARNIDSVFHYVPLHSSPAGRRFGRCAGALPHTDDLAARLIRLPLWHGLAHLQQRVIDEVHLAVMP